MSQSELLARTVEVLETAGIEYMVTGSFASSFHGEPRATHDIDLVVALAPAAIDDLVRSFPAPDYYLDPESMAEAIARRDMFNLIDVRSGDKVDFWLLTDEPFDQARFARRRRENALGRPLTVSTAEDTILAKLRWAEMSGGSEKQFGDSLRIYELQHSSLDQSYLDYWAVELRVTDLLARLRAEAEPMTGPEAAR